MRYDIRMTLTYEYRPPILNSRHLLRLLPRNIPGEQQLVSGLVRVDPRPDERADGTDFFGNARADIAYARPVDRLVVTLAARVQRLGPPPGPDASPRLAALAGEVAAAASLDPDAPAHFLGDSPRVRRHAALTRFARSAVPADATALQAVTAVGRALHRRMVFDSTATDVDTDPLEAFQLRRGVCQDFTHIMIGALRGLGVPAGYVSGFLRTLPPPGKPRLEGADAMHAWVMAWCGARLGWMQFDPTNDTLVGTDHIVVALGRDYSDVSPITGSIRALGRHVARQAVDVIPQ
jgi:transglutaminase-like putative cysteine protease